MLKINGGRALYIPLATTEGALVASTNRGCSALMVLYFCLSKLAHLKKKRISDKTLQDEKQIKVFFSKSCPYFWDKLPVCISNIIHFELFSKVVVSQLS